MKSKNTEKELAQKELAQQQPDDLSKWQNKLQHHRNSLSIIGIVLLFILGATSISVISQKNRAEKAWQVIGEVWQTTSAEQVLPSNFFQSKAFFNLPSTAQFRDENFPPEFKIKDLRDPARKFLHEILGDDKGLAELALPEEKEKAPEEMIEKSEAGTQASLDNTRLRSLPPSLAQKAFRLHNIEILEQQLQSARKTTVEPWIYHTLAQMYSLENPDKRDQYLKVLRDKHPNFPLLSPLVTSELKTEPDTIQSVWSKKEPKLLKYEEKLYRDATGVVLTTSRGKVKLVLLEKESPAACRYFAELVGSGFFNGLNFYRVDNEKVWSGCPVGNGKGEPDRTVSEKAQDVWPHRGLVLMDTLSTPGKVGSRFFILKKFADLSEQYVVLGLVSEGMDVVDQLTREDLLLDAAVAR